MMTSSEAVAVYDALRHRSSTSRHYPEYNALIDVHQDLCNALPINDLFPGLISRRVISVVDKEKLCLGRIEQERAELFLERHLHRQLLAGETEKFNDFITTMKESPKCSFLVKRIMDRVVVHQNETSVACTAANSESADVNMAYIETIKQTLAKKKSCSLVVFLFIVFNIVLYVPVVLVLIQLQNQVMVLQSRVDSGCTVTTIVLQPTPTAHKQDTYLSSDTQYNSSETVTHDFELVPLIVIMEDFHEAMKHKEVWKSNPFFAFDRGYLMYLSVYPAGFGDGEGSHVSVYLHLMKGPYDDELQDSGYWPLRGTFTIELLNVYNNYTSHSHHNYLIMPHFYLCESCTSRVMEESETRNRLGYSQYISHVTLLYSYQHFYDSLHLRISYSSHRNRIINHVILQQGKSILFVCCLIFYVLLTFCALCNIPYDWDKDNIIAGLVMWLLNVVDLIQVLACESLGIDDSISASLHYVLQELSIISAYVSIAVAVLGSYRLYCFLKEFNHQCEEEIKIIQKEFAARCEKFEKEYEMHRKKSEMLWKKSLMEMKKILDAYQVHNEVSLQT